MENGFSSPRSDAFPAGLRVLVVDDDMTWLKLLEKMLKKCSYDVTTCGLATDALRLLRELKDGFDIVISDVNMPDMDGFKLLEHVGLEMDLPVIMMSVDGETSRVMKGVQHGACDYLLKPIRMKELKNIWQHVFRKKIHEIRDIESGHDGLIMSSNGHCDEAYSFLGFEDFAAGGCGAARKRKDYSENRQDERDYNGEAASSKKARVVWSVDLHQKFVKAVNHIGFDKVGPKKILDLMNVSWLTRENVASHLQKYRLYLSRLQKEKETDPKASLPFPGNYTLEDDLKGIASEPSTTITTANTKPEASFVADFSGQSQNYSSGGFGREHKPILHHEENITKLPLPDPAEETPSVSSKKPEFENREPVYTSTSSSFQAADLESASLRSLPFDCDEFQFVFHQGSGDFLGDSSGCFDGPGINYFNDATLFYAYDALRFGFDYPFYDPTDYSKTMADQSLLTW